MFKKTVNLENGKLVITISCEKRSNANEPKTIFGENVEDSIPEDIKNSVSLISAPEETLSNMAIPGHCQSANWIYEIEKPKKTEPRTRSPRRRTQSKKST